MIINNNLATELSYNNLNTNLNVLSTSDLTHYKSFKNFYEKKRNTFMKNNVFNEIEAIKEKNAENEIDYLSILQISSTEYEKSLQDMDLITKELNDEDLTDVMSIKKLISVYKHILEMFSYLIGLPFFDWRKFKDRLNLHEVKFKMENINFRNYSPRMINCFLTKISKNKNFNGKDSVGYLRIRGFSKLFTWVKAVLKVYLYRVQNNQKGGKVIQGSSSGLSSNALSPFNKSDLIEVKNLRNDKTDRMRVTNSEFMPKIVNMKLSNREEISNDITSGIEYEEIKVDKNKIGNGFFFTNINTQSKETNTRLSTPPKVISNIKIQNTLPKLRIKNKKLELNFDIVEDKIERERKAIKSMPFMKNKTFHQLRKYFDLLKYEQFVINHKHFEELEKVSMKNPENVKKIMNYISTNKMKEIDDEAFEKFIENLRENSKY